LKIGIVEDDSFKINIIKEILNHQGILYEVCSKNNIQDYPCVISTEKNIKHENLILIDNEPLNNFFDALSGVSKFKEEYMVNASLTEYEIQLTEKIRNCFHKQNLPFARKWFWPDLKKACCIITHDIDDIDKCPSKKRSKLECVKYVLSHLISKPYGDNINALLKLEDEKSIKSTLYFLSKYPYEKVFMNLPEYIYEKHFVKVLNNVKSKGHEIGLHGSPETSSDPELLAKEKKKVEIVAEIEIAGQRQHTLKFTTPETWEILENAGLRYDTTFSYNRKFGFRAGICYPYHPFNKQNKKFNILEIPMSFMDSIGYQYKNYTKDQYLNVINKLANTVEKYNGCLIVNFHNAFINKRLFPEIYETFLETLEYVSEKDYWIITARECADWWLKRENAKLDIYFENGEIIGKSSIKMPIEIQYPGNKIKRVEIDNELAKC